MAAQRHSGQERADEQPDLGDMLDAGLGALFASVGHVARLTPDPGETVPTQETVNRVFLLLLRLWHEASPNLLDVLRRHTFVTRTGDGVLQLEWEQAGRYLEVEIRQDGPLAVLTECRGADGEAEYNELALVDDELGAVLTDLFAAATLHQR